jgi:hypothetical protein
VSLPSVDLREVPLESLPQAVHEHWHAQDNGQLLTISRRPHKKWTTSLDFARPLVLSSSPMFEQILWTDRESSLPLPESVQQEQDALLAGYHRLFRGEGSVETYLKTLRRHVEEQEAVFYPALLKLAPLERALRELGYEHQGLLKNAAQLCEAVPRHQAGQLARKEKDRLDLDFFHLLEHHLERERDAIVPAWVALTKKHFSPKNL